jgi:ankyrin repeat protein
MELLTAANKEGYTPLINACANSATEIVKAIFAAVKEMIPEEERAELLMRLLTATNNEGYMPLISACANNSHDIVKAIFAAVRKMIPEEKRA